jgi:hypothetical protein
VDKEMIEPLYDERRVRAAISISPDGQLHIGHLFIIICAQEISKRYNFKFHLRFDDIYAKTSKDHTQFPQKSDRWSSGNPHVPIPGRSIWEMRRPPHMIETQVKSNIVTLENLGIVFDKIYNLTDIEKEIRGYYESSPVPWLADLPIYFTEDIAWKDTLLCRGEDWKRDGEHGYWVKLQEFLLKYVKRSGYRMYYLPHILTDDGQKISKSNPDHSRYILNNMKRNEILKKIDEFKEKAKKFID